MFALKIPGEPVWRPTSVDGNMTGALKIPSFNACQVPSTKCWGSFTEFCVIIFAKFLSWLKWVPPQQLSIQKSSKIHPLYELFCTQLDKTGPAVKVSTQNIFEPFDHRVAAEIRSCDTLLEMGFELRGGGGQARKIEGGSGNGQEMESLRNKRYIQLSKM